MIFYNRNSEWWNCIIYWEMFIILSVIVKEKLLVWCKYCVLKHEICNVYHKIHMKRIKNKTTSKCNEFTFQSIILQLLSGHYI